LKAQLWAQVLPHITVHPDLAIATGEQTAWAVRKNNTHLKQLLDGFIQGPSLDVQPVLLAVCCPIFLRRRNEIERLFRRLKGFRRIFSRFDKLDLVFLAFLHFALIVEALRYLISVNTP
jgi:hypothetical protein